MGSECLNHAETEGGAADAAAGQAERGAVEPSQGLVELLLPDHTTGAVAPICEVFQKLIGNLGIDRERFLGEYARRHQLRCVMIVARPFLSAHGSPRFLLPSAGVQP